MNEKKEKVIGKIILTATVVNKSNLLTGSGRGDVLDFELIREEGRLLIPASGFAGMMRKHFYKHLNLGPTQKQQAEYLWGTGKKEQNELEKQDKTSQSHIIIDDLICKKGTATVVVRDGVAINMANGIAESKSKYDYELIEPGAEFSLNAEITLREEFDVNTFLQFVKFITQQGEYGEYRQGAFTSHGFGQLGWQEIKVLHFKFPQDASLWFSYLKSELGEIDKAKAILPPVHGIVLNDIRKATITGVFSIKNSLIIGASDTKMLFGSLDKTHIKNSKGHPLLTSKSLRGPIRHRALKILNTIGIGNPKAQGIVNTLFGYVNKENKEDKHKGKIIPTEYTFDDLGKIDAKQVQPRIKIDRFTGGTMNTALLSSQPVWHKEENIRLEFEIENFIPDEIALLLLVMKDLMNEDLPIGGEKAIGRGVLTGKRLTLKRDPENYFDLLVLPDGSVAPDGKGEFDLNNIENWIGNLNNS